MTADGAPAPPSDDAADADRAGADAADAGAGAADRADASESIRSIRRPAAAPGSGRRRAAPSNARSAGPIRSIDVAPTQDGPVPATGPVPVRPGTGTPSPGAPAPGLRVPVPPAGDSDDDEGVDDVVAGPAYPRPSTGPLDTAPPPAPAAAPASASEAVLLGTPAPRSPDERTPVQTTGGFAIAHGRRRSMSRHAHSSGVPASVFARWAGRRGAWVVSLLPALALTALVQWWSMPADRLPSGAGRFGPAGAFAALRPGALAGYQFVDARFLDAPPFAWLQTGVVTAALTGVAGVPPLLATRALQVVLALIGVALVWLIVRRSPSSGLASFAAAATSGATPMAVAVHSEPLPIGLAVVWLLGACTVAQVRPAQSRPPKSRAVPARAIAVGACTAAAVLTSPWAALGAIAPLWLLARSDRVRIARPVRTVALGVLTALLVLAAAVATGAALQQAPAGAGSADLGRLADAASAFAPPAAVGLAAWRSWATIDPLGLLVGAIALVVAVRRRRLAPVVVTALLVVAAAFAPLGSDAVTAPALLLPALAILTGSAVDRAVVLLGRPALAISVIGAGWLMGIVALLVVAVAQWSLGLGGLSGAPGRAADQARHWVGASVPAGQVVLVGLAAWPDVARGARASVGWYAADPGQPSGLRNSAPWSSADYIVADAQLRAHAAGVAAAVLRRSVPVAAFGSGAAALQVRAVPAATQAEVPAQAPGQTAAQKAAAADRASTGAELARNPRIVLSGSDRVLLRTGRVDRRVILVLGQLLAAHTVTVAAFPPVAGEPDGPRRQVLISGIDAQDVPADIQRTGILLRYLSSLRGSFSTSGIDATPNGVLATLDVGPTP